MNESSEQVELSEQEAESDNERAASTVKRGGLVVLGVIALTLSLYLLADRFTPYTDQARIQRYVIGVAPQVSGIVRKVWVENDQRVEEGDRLFQIDPLQYEIALAKAESDLENTMRQVEAGDAGVDAARANLASAQANLDKAEKDTTRLQRLREQDPGTISTRRLEISRASLDQARAAVAAAEAQIQQAIEQKGGGDKEGEENSKLKVARTAVEKARLDLERTVVTASSRGVITDLRADVGLYAAAGGPVLTLVAMTDVWVRAEFTENNLGHLREGTPVEILFDALPGQVFSGAVSSIGLGVSAGQAPPPGTLPSIDNSRDWLRPSQRFPVNVRFDPGQEDDLRSNLRIGGQASVVAFGTESGPLKWLAQLYIRLMSLFAFAY
jgi:multidrug resistance efflux pump